MNPNEKEIYELVKENNHILKGMRRASRWTSIFRVIYWVLIIGASLGAYYFVQPYVDTLVKSYQGIRGDINNVKSVVNKIPTTVSNMLK